MRNYHIVTFGCQMNIHESEKIAGILEFLNYSEISNIEDADVLVFNTCCVRDTAEKRALGHIGNVKKLKEKKKDMIICVLGCMPQQQGFAENFKKSYPYVDIILGNASIDKLIELIPAVASEKKKQKFTYINPNDKPKITEGEKIYRTSGVNAWVNIMYGCNNFCTYCIVPYVRGRERSRSMDNIIEEVKSLLSQGYKEITLLGQNVNSYGNDLNDGTTFAKLLKEIDQIEGKFRVRFMSSHPKDFNDDVIDIIAASNKICDNIHLPIQAGSNHVLKLMNRRYTKEQYLEIIKKIKEKIPHVGLTTDIMVGFPYETEEDFQDTLDVVRQVRYIGAFTFIYSMRSGTKAAEMEQIPYTIKSERIQRLIKEQNKIIKEISKNEYEGKVFEVLCENIASDSKDKVCGRTDTGRMVTFSGDGSLIGQFVNVKITSSKSSSLFGDIVYK